MFSQNGFQLSLVTKTKIIMQADHKGCRHSSEPIEVNQIQKQGNTFVSPVDMENQSKCEFCNHEAKGGELLVYKYR